MLNPDYTKRVYAEVERKNPAEGEFHQSVYEVFTSLEPVFIGDTITATVTVSELIPEKNRAILETVCTNQNGDVVIKGSATVMPPKA